jgi:hypothetical protein
MKIAELFSTLSIRPDEASFHKANRAIESVKDGLKRAAEVFLGFEAGKAILEAIKGTSELAEGALHAAKALGTTSAAIQELNYTAQATGTSTEEMQTSLMHLARSTQEAKKGTGEQADAFRKLGISMNDPAIKSGDTSQIFERLADSFNNLPDGAEKTALAMTLLGRSGSKMIPLLDRGSTALSLLRQEAEQSGYVIGGEAAEGFEKLNEKTSKLKLAFTGLKNQAIEKLLPPLTEMIDKLTAWIAEHHEQVVHALGKAFQVVATVVKTFGAMIAFAAKHTTVLKAILAALVAVFVNVAYEAAIAWAAASGPIALVAAAVAGLVILVEKYGRQIADFFIGVATSIKDAFVEVFDWIAAKFQWVADKAQAVAKAIKGFFSMGPLSDEDKEKMRQSPLAKHLLLHEWNDDANANAQPGAASPFDAFMRAANGGEPMRAVAGAGGGDVTNNVSAPLTVNVDAGNADAKGVVDLIRREIADHHDGVWREIDMAMGGHEDER